ncbi:MAG: hypothetical protein GF308_07090 [Candidatus Heimdallarchaeota archaeon]|nr:hypothetical protein [Candidatus Heimdallarchaeota archaeon]
MFFYKKVSIFQSVHNFIVEEQWKKALEEIHTIKKEDLTIDEKYMSIILESYILNRLERFMDAFLLTKELLMKRERITNKLIILDALIVQAESFIHLERFTDGLSTIVQAEEMLPIITNLPLEKQAERQAYIILEKGLLSWKKGHIDEALEKLQESVQIYRGINHQIMKEKVFELIEEIKLYETAIKPMAVTIPKPKTKIIDSSTINNISGVGDIKAEILQKAGYHTIEEIASADPKELVSLKGFGPATATKVIKNAQELYKKMDSK